MTAKHAKHIDVVFDGPIGGPESGRFVEVEDHTGKSVDIGLHVNEGGSHRLRFMRSMFGLTELNPMDTVPKNGSYVQLWLNSGYSSTPMRCEIAHWTDVCWRTYANDSIYDAGGNADDLLGWLPLPAVPDPPEKDPAYNFDGNDQWKCLACGTANHPLRNNCRNCRVRKR